jgi:3-oxoacyl-[acyl-carrier protein] reductase
VNVGKGDGNSSVALVTGTRKGIGRHLAEHLLRGGYDVVGCSREEPDWEAQRFTHVAADVSDEQDVKRLLARVRELHGRLDVVINNAGVASMNAALLTPGSSARRMMDVNLVGTFQVSREAAKLMRRHSFGRIVNLSSVAVPLRLAGQAAYVASKAAVESLSQVLAREFAPFGITVNVVGPPPIDTDMTRGVPREKLERVTDALAIGRMGTFADVSNVIDFFLREESSAVTGQTIYLGGVPNT